MDQELVEATRNELHSLLNEPLLSNAVLLILANKQDLPNAMDCAVIAEKLGLVEYLSSRRVSQQSLHKWNIQEACAISGDGLYNGLEWLLSSYLVSPCCNCLFEVLPLAYLILLYNSHALTHLSTNYLHADALSNSPSLSVSAR